MRELWNRILAIFRRRSIDRDLERELQFHLEMKTAESGNPAEARRAVGGSLAWRERARDVWGWTVLDELFRDIRYAIRGLMRSPGFAIAAIVTLALGIGASTLMFSVADATLLRPFPFPEPDRLVILWETTPHYSHTFFHLPVYEALAANNPVMELGTELSATFDVGETPYPEKLSGERVTGSYLDVLQVKPLRGRSINAEDETAASNVAMISERFWRSHFDSNPAVIGSSLPIRANGMPGIYTIIGVLPPEAQTPFAESRDIWIPLQVDREASGRGLYILGRLKPGVSREAAEAVMKSKIAGLGTMDEKEPATATVESWQKSNRQYNLSGMEILGLAVAFVLLIACASVANLILARGAERIKELSVRAAIGAGRGRLFSQLLTESLVLGLLGGTLGTAIAYVSVGSARALIPAGTLRRDLVAVDARVLAFALVVSLAASVLLGLLPAWRASRTDLRPLLAGARGGGRERTFLRSFLIVSEITLALMLVTGAVLLLQSFYRLSTRDVGFDRSNLLTLQTGIPIPIYQDTPARIQIEREIQSRLSALPGVRFVALTDVRPLGNMFMALRVAKLPAGSTGPLAWAAVSPEYFSAMQIPLRRGRLFSGQDLPGSPDVAIISELAARRYWPDEDPIGKSVSMTIGSRKATSEIVGVVGDTVWMSLEGEVMPAIYAPHAQELASSGIQIVIRVQPGISTAKLIPAVRTELASINGGLSVDTITPMSSVIYEQLARPRFFAVILGVFAVLAVTLTITAVAGVIAYLVRARTYEFGVRMILGATQGNVLRLILSYGGNLALVGIVLGSSASYALAHVLTSYLYEVQPHDKASMVVAPIILFITVLTACYVPARRATRIDPAQSLRHD